MKQYAYPDVNTTDKERSATSLKTTAGFKHHKLKVCVQLLGFPDTITKPVVNWFKLFMAIRAEKWLRQTITIKTTTTLANYLIKLYVSSHS